MLKTLCVAPRLQAISLLALALAVLVSCEPTGRDLQRWRLPSDLPRWAGRLTALRLPSGVDRLDWLPPNLERLEASGAAITSLPPLPSGLRSLDLSYSSLRDPFGLPSTLKWLDLRFTKVKDFQGIPNGIESLAVGGKAIVSFAGIPSTLRELTLEKTPHLRDLAHLPPGLESLTLIGTEFDDLEDLPPQLRALTLRETKIKSLTGIPGSLQSLEIVNNPQLQGEPQLSPLLSRLILELTGTDVSGLRYLTVLDVRRAGIGQGSLSPFLRLWRVNAASLPALPSSLRHLAIVRGGSPICSNSRRTSKPSSCNGRGSQIPSNRSPDSSGWT